MYDEELIGNARDVLIYYALTRSCAGKPRIQLHTAVRDVCPPVWLYIIICIHVYTTWSHNIIMMYTI